MSVQTKNDNNKNNVRISRSLSWLLRHDSTAPLDAAGWLSVETVLARRLAPSLDEELLRTIVREDAKGRYQLRRNADGVLQIRAVQGHSVSVIDEAVALTPLLSWPPGAVARHGTSAAAWQAIQRDRQVRTGRRRHVHWAFQVPHAPRPRSVQRDGCQVLLRLDGPAALAAGHKLWVSENGVLLSLAMPLDFVERENS